MKIDISAETMKVDAARYIDEWIAKHRGKRSNEAAKIISPFVERGPIRELVILFMCGYAARVVETAIVLVETERERGRR